MERMVVGFIPRLANDPRRLVEFDCDGAQWRLHFRH